jgi:hypothetical protein
LGLNIASHRLKSVAITVFNVSSQDALKKQNSLLNTKLSFAGFFLNRTFMKMSQRRDKVCESNTRNYLGGYEPVAPHYREIQDSLQYTRLYIGLYKK